MSLAVSSRQASSLQYEFHIALEELMNSSDARILVFYGCVSTWSQIVNNLIEICGEKNKRDPGASGQASRHPPVFRIDHAALKAD
jgi:hypothetical protein